MGANVNAMLLDIFVSSFPLLDHCGWSERCRKLTDLNLIIHVCLKESVLVTDLKLAT